jgi:hypothetical protein
MPTPLRCATMIAFNFEDLLQASNEDLLQRFGLVRRVNPMLVPTDVRTEACRITRAPDAITLHFYRRESPEEVGPETFRFSFLPAN